MLIFFGLEYIIDTHNAHTCMKHIASYVAIASSLVYQGMNHDKLFFKHILCQNIDVYD